MDPEVRRITRVTDATTAVVSFVTQPIPAADELLVVPMHYWLCVKIARARGAKVRSLPWRSIQRIIWYGAGARFAVHLTAGLVPVVGAFSNSITAIALTEYLARALDAHLDRPEEPIPEVSVEALKTLFSSAIASTRVESTASPAVTP